jgi:hypothetical protein
VIKFAGIRNKEKEVQKFLLGGLPLVTQEPATTAWFGLRLGPGTFGIFGAVPDEAGREAHLSGKVAWAFMAKAGELFSAPLSVELASKLPDQGCPSRMYRKPPGSRSSTQFIAKGSIAQAGNGVE